MCEELEVQDSVLSNSQKAEGPIACRCWDIDAKLAHASSMALSLASILLDSRAEEGLLMFEVTRAEKVPTLSIPIFGCLGVGIELLRTVTELSVFQPQIFVFFSFGRLVLDTCEFLVKELPEGLGCVE